MSRLCVRLPSECCCHSHAAGRWAMPWALRGSLRRRSSRPERSTEYHANRSSDTTDFTKSSNSGAQHGAWKDTPPCYSDSPGPTLCFACLGFRAPVQPARNRQPLLIARRRNPADLVIFARGAPVRRAPAAPDATAVHCRNSVFRGHSAWATVRVNEAAHSMHAGGTSHHVRKHPHRFGQQSG
jgi:hypothetical protein